MGHEPKIVETTAQRHIELLKAVRSDLQDFLSAYERDDEIEDWDSVAACTNALIQVDMSVHGAIEWMEVHAGMRPRPQPQDPWGGGVMPVDVTPPGDNGDDDATHGSYL